MHGLYLLNNLMELSWVLIVVISCITITITTILLKFSSNKLKLKSNKLKLIPPGPKNVPIITMLIWLTKSLKESQRVLRELSSKYGPIITLSSSSSRTDIFISSRYLVYEALVKKATIFADRPKEFLSNLLNSNNQPSITLANYGSLWRLLRGNLTSQILNPSRIKEFESARTWVLDILLDELRVCASGSSGSSSHEGEKKKEIVKVKEHFRYAMFHLLVLMCFGDKMEESRIKQIESTLQELLSAFFSRFWVLNFSQRWLTKIIFPNRWKQYYSIKKKQQDLLIPFIRARKKFQESTNTIINTCYLDTLLNLEIPINSNNTKNSNDRIKKTRKLSEEEIVSLCFEFLTGGTDSTSTTLEWVMANIVKNPKIQTDLYEEIKGYIGENAKKVEENVLPNLCYLKAVILEGLRRHPPGHFLLNHGVTQEVHLGGYVIPKNASINFVVADMGLDPDVWEDPMEFKPERFLKGGDHINVEYHREFVDENGVLKMIPFGAGRRICPGQGLALLHLEYFVANLVWNFEWKGVDGDEIDLCEKQEFTIVMKYPLQAHISPRKII